MHIFWLRSVKVVKKTTLMINTDKGLYKFDRLHFGVKVSRNIFQQIIDAILPGCSEAYLDDILIRGEKFLKKGHAVQIEKVFQRIEYFGFKVSDTRCEVFMTCMNYFVQIRHEREIPDNKRCSVLEFMRPPSNVLTLQNFPGLVNYHSIYEPNIHIWRAPLNNFLKEDVK